MTMNMRMSMAAAALVGFGFIASQVSADVIHVKIPQCQFATTGFNNVGFDNIVCSFYGSGNWASGSSLSGFHAPNQKGVIAELKGASFGDDWIWPEVGGRGYNGTTPITGCWTGYDRSIDGNTVGDGSGCQNMTKHILEFYFGQVLDI